MTGSETTLDHRGTARRAPGEFTTEKGEALMGMTGVKMLELDSKGGPGKEPIYGEFRWK